MRRVSIIIPFFNTDLTLFRQCLQSVRDQTFEDYEVIVVDDGSEPSCSRKAEVTFRSLGFDGLFHRKENGGVSSARNAGVSFARGEYVMFLDSDDLIDPDFLKLVFSNDSVPELIVGRIKSCSFEQGPLSLNGGRAAKIGFEVVRPEWLKRRFLGAHEVDHDEFSDYRSGPVSCLLLAEKAAEVSFDEELSFGEDTIWNLEALDSVDSVGLVDWNAYGYRRVEKSLSTAYRESMLEDIERFLVRAHHFVQDNADLAEFERLVVVWAFNVYRNQARKPKAKHSILTLNEAMRHDPWKTALRHASKLGLPNRYFAFSLLLKNRFYGVALAIGRAGLRKING